MTVILEMSTLIGQLDNVREDYITAGGLKTLLAVYWDNHSTINVERFGAALLDLEQPWKVLRRSKYYILGPSVDYEMNGDVPNVVFPCATLTDPATGRIAIYYGCADTVTGLAFTTVDELMAWMEAHPL